MASVAGQAVGRRVSTGRVFERAFATIKHNPAVTLGLALIVGAIPGVLSNYLMTLVRGDLLTSDGTFNTNFIRGFWGFTVVSWVFALIISALVQAVLTRATVAQSEGRKASFGECLSAAGAVLLPLIGLGLMIGIGVMIGFMLIFVPGIILYIVWSVASPALIEERRGVFGSLSRSAHLTKGERWKIFGLLLILFILYYMLAAVFGIAGFSTGAFQGGAMSLPVFYLVMMTVLGTLMNLVWGTVQASLYVELRNAKDGPAVDQLEDVFG